MTDVFVLGVPSVVGQVLGDNLAWVVAGLAIGLALLFGMAGIRLQQERDRPLALAIEGSDIVLNNVFLSLDDGQGTQITAALIGVSGEFINRGNLAVSASFSLRLESWTISGSSYDFSLRANEAGRTAWRVLPNSLHNPLHLGAAREHRSNRLGVIGFFPDDDELKRRHLRLHDLLRGDLVAVDRFSLSGASQTWRLADLLRSQDRS